MKAFAFAAVLVSGVSVLSSLAVAGDSPAPLCSDVKKVKADFSAKGDSWRALTPAQFYFLSDIYAMHPKEPEGLPPANGAVLAFKAGSPIGVIFFTKGTKVCNPMMAPPQLTKLLDGIISLAGGKVDLPAAPSSKDDDTTQF